MKSTDSHSLYSYTYNQIQFYSTTLRFLLSFPERSNLPPRSFIADNFPVSMQRQCHTGRRVLERDRFINLQPYTLTFENAQHITLFAGEEGGSFYSVRVVRAGFDQGAKLAVQRASAANTLRWMPGTSTRHALGPPLSVNASACFESLSNDFRSAASS